MDGSACRLSVIDQEFRGDVATKFWGIAESRRSCKVPRAGRLRRTFGL